MAKGDDNDMRTSSLLINEPPLQVLPSLAVAIGLNEAIALQQLHYWLSNPKTGVERDGEKWVFNTYEEWKENFPFWSISTIQRTFSNLEKMGLVISAQLDAQKRAMHKFYRIDYDQLDALHDVNLTSSIVSNCDDGSSQDDMMLTETTTETNPEKTAVVVAQPPNVYRVYEQEIGPLTPMVGEMLTDIEQTYPPGWFIEAVREAKKSTPRVSLRYVEAILRRWKAEGRSQLPKKPERRPPQLQKIVLPDGTYSEAIA
jgi:DnaD/phage-associated family protein